MPLRDTQPHTHTQVSHINYLDTLQSGVGDTIILRMNDELSG